MPLNAQKNLIPYLYLFITDIAQLPTVKRFSNYEQQEPGFALPFIEAYRHAFQAKTDKIPDLFQEVNAIAIKHLAKTRPGEYRNNSGHFDVSLENLVDENGYPLLVSTYSMTEKGLQEFIKFWMLNESTQAHHAIVFETKEAFQDQPSFILGYLPKYRKVLWTEISPSGKIQYTPFDMETHFPIILSYARNYCYTVVLNIMPETKTPALDTEKQMNVLATSYQCEMKVAKSKNEKITAIARYIQHVEQLHPFLDGNIRTCNIMMNKLLRDNHLPLSILYNPNIFDCCDIETVVQMIKEGQKTYLQLLANENADELLLDASHTPWIHQQTHIRCEASHDIEQEALQGFAHDVLSIPKMRPVSGLFSAKQQTNANTLILDLFPMLAANRSSHCPEIRTAIEQCEFGLALRRACAFGEYAIVNKILDFVDELEINLTDCSSNGKNALAWLETSVIVSEKKDALIKRLSGMMPQPQPLP